MFIAVQSNRWSGDERSLAQVASSAKFATDGGHTLPSLPSPGEMIEPAPGSARPGRALRSDFAYRRLKGDILTCRLPPGRVVTAAELAERFGMSRTPVNEALGALSREGYLEVVPRAGHVVTPVTRRDIEEIYELRLCNEVLGAGMAAERATDLDVAALRKQYERAKSNLGTGSPTDSAYLESIVADNREFHVSIAKVSGNRRLARIVGDLLDEGHRLYFLFYQASQSRNAGDMHGNIIKAIAARNPKEAREAMAYHINEMHQGTPAGTPFTAP